MLLRNALRLAVVVSVVSPLAGCPGESTISEIDAPRELALGFCDAVFACACVDSAGFGSVEGCRESTGQALLTQQNAAVNAGLIYDASCVAEDLDKIETLACTRALDEPPACDDCFTYHGLLPEGSQCDRLGPDASTCEQGLRCADRFGEDGTVYNVCVPACERVGESEACALDGPYYQVRRECAEGLVCDATSTGVCVLLPTPGMVCRSGACAPGAWCDTAAPDPVCAALKSDGAGCSTDIECASTWCRGQRCAQPLAKDLACAPGNDRCAEGLQCREDRPICSPVDALICRGAAPVL
jgi:hypothetical protein